MCLFSWLCNVFKLLSFYLLIYLSHVFMYLDYHCFIYVCMFYSLYYIIIIVLINVYIRLRMPWYIHMIIENYLRIKGEKYEWKYVCVF